MRWERSLGSGLDVSLEGVVAGRKVRLRRVTPTRFASFFQVRTGRSSFISLIVFIPCRTHQGEPRSKTRPKGTWPHRPFGIVARVAQLVHLASWGRWLETKDSLGGAGRLAPPKTGRQPLQLDPPLRVPTKNCGSTGRKAEGGGRNAPAVRRSGGGRRRAEGGRRRTEGGGRKASTGGSASAVFGRRAAVGVRGEGEGIQMSSCGNGLKVIIIDSWRERRPVPTCPLVEFQTRSASCPTRSTK